MDITLIMRYPGLIGSDRSIDRESESRILRVNDSRELSDQKLDVMGPVGTVDQCGKFDYSVDHESFESVSSFRKYPWFAYSRGRPFSGLNSVGLVALLAGCAVGPQRAVCARKTRFGSAARVLRILLCVSSSNSPHVGWLIPSHMRRGFLNMCIESTMHRYPRSRPPRRGIIAIRTGFLVKWVRHRLDVRWEAGFIKGFDGKSRVSPVISLTQPDISFDVNKLSQFVHSPSETHWQALKCFICYLKGTISFGLHLCRHPSYCLYAFFDANWVGDRDDCKSTTGYVVYLGGNLIFWSSRKQPSISCSSTEVEYRSIAVTTPHMDSIFTV
ncbi:unnamed protein product [Prunus armeniaca]